MSKLLIFVSATIVLIFANAPTFAAPPAVSPEPPEEKSTWPDGKPDENLSITNAPDPVLPTPQADAHYYPYRQALTFRTGLSSDFPKINFDETVFGFQYLFPKFLSPKLEAGADLQEHNRGHLHAGLRWFAWEREYFRPSGKISLDHLAESKERLATLTRIDNYYVRLSGTIEYVVWNPYSIRVEHELLINLDRCWQVMTLGISRGW
jgi:hypothetical protein